MVIQFDVKEDRKKGIIFITDAEGNDVIRAPLLNKGTGFTEEERKTFGLGGLIPPRVLSIEQQVQIIFQRYYRLGLPIHAEETGKSFNKIHYYILKKEIDIARYNFLRDLQDRNEILFYAFAYKYLEDVIPIIYTPTVGDAVQRYSRDSASFRGIFISPHNIDNTYALFDHVRFKKPTIAVVTDNQGILGIGDQGVGGIDIPIGKLALYVLGAGIRPWETLPVTLDVGTDNPEDLEDLYYLGYKFGRLIGPKYEEFINKFVNGIREKFPDILIQWEDFSRQNAFTILDKYQYKILSFNDDIQGTGSVALAGILNALKCSSEELKEQRFVIYGAGAGGIGIARQIVESLKSRCKLSESSSYSRIAILDSKGLITDEKKLDSYKQPFSMEKQVYDGWEVEDKNRISLYEVVRNFYPSVLIGTSGQYGHFTLKILKSMAKQIDRPIIFPLSNPTSNAEATPLEIFKATNGKAIVAVGSPFDPFHYDGKNNVIGQGNNLFIFPGVGLGAILSHADYISDEVFTEAAYRLSDLTQFELISKGTVYPPIKDIREISAHIAHLTHQYLSQDQETCKYSFEDIKSKMWIPKYCPIKKM